MRLLFFKKRYLSFLFVLTLLSSCRYDVTKFDIPDWEVNLLGPLATMDLKLEELTELQRLVYSKEISLIELGFAPGPITFPQVILPTVGPVEVNTLDAFKNILLDSLVLQLTLTNDFPFLIEKGIRIHFVNKESGSAIYSFEVTEDIPAGSTYITGIKLINTLVESTILISATDMYSGPTQSLVLKPDDGMVFTFELLFLKIAEAWIHPSQHFSYTQTADFNLQGGALDANAIEGILNLFVTNPYPVSGEVQVYFFSSNRGTVIDSLFQPIGTLLLPAIAGSEVTLPSESKFSIPINMERMDSLKQADRVYITFNISTPDGQQDYKAVNLKGLEGILTGDLKVHINN